MTGALYLVRPDGKVFVVVPSPIRCAACGAMHCFFINYGGRTVCIYCDSKRRSNGAQNQV